MAFGPLGRSPTAVAVLTALVMMGFFIAYETSVASRPETQYVSSCSGNTKCSCGRVEDSIIQVDHADLTVRSVNSAPGKVKTLSQSRLKFLKPGAKPVCKSGRIDHGCYCLEENDEGLYPPEYKLLSQDVLKKRECKKRRPDAIMAGSMKCGTTALKAYLEIHPGISFARDELKFANHHKVEEFDEYRKVMPYSTPDQVAMEKTPGYILRIPVAERIREAMPETKIIFIFREPIFRAVSNYMHMLAINESHPDFLESYKDKERKAPEYEIRSTFEESVLYPDGSVKSNNRLIDTSNYVKYLKAWYELFPREQVLVLDGEEFTNNPVPGLRQVENFLGLDPFFDESNFYFNETKGFLCLRDPFDMCMKSTKGRPHVAISDDLARKLQDYFRPFNRKLAKVLGRELSWTDSY